MKRHGILNSQISKVLADLGHTDTIVIADCGLPIPAGVARIDLALELGTPSFVDVVRIVADDMAVEQVTLATEIKAANPVALEAVMKLDVPQDYVSHEAFKELTKQAKVIIRTGEATPYANVILHAGVIF
ncbi:RbsD or FucU transport [Exiguobacterium sibiricum 255-15]|uniref:D-ribose pyranase n=1 Tax=Exiguobacterium sibiricum (strain DSM 17290 / CCUG 55495 / CIP 109462 / JCM 13490 / 255-15) TaxID=262543 RepID=RBSD_EXIS2|nr:D-ribose pyranase [Exiguobacterium sibiricum]B1YL34.1 RecName: Full=D-ribose pyranase [Exiguobacterium sibiricum 255-15]ACB61836.1 RbsD or FucU transport [Exiguobacterium sibiricum 255-15]